MVLCFEAAIGIQLQHSPIGNLDRCSHPGGIGHVPECNMPRQSGSIIRALRYSSYSALNLRLEKQILTWANKTGVKVCQFTLPGVRPIEKVILDLTPPIKKFFVPMVGLNLPER